MKIVEKKWRSMALCLLALLGFSLSAQAQTSESADRDASNTRMNKTEGLTADDQSLTGESDTQLDARIRRAIVERENLSTSAHNIKIVVQSGKVTLRGPVQSLQEKNEIDLIAKQIAGKGNVINQLDIANDK